MPSRRCPASTCGTHAANSPHAAISLHLTPSHSTPHPPMPPHAIRSHPISHDPTYLTPTSSPSHPTGTRRCSRCSTSHSSVNASSSTRSTSRTNTSRTRRYVSTHIPSHLTPPHSRRFAHVTSPMPPRPPPRTHRTSPIPPHPSHVIRAAGLCAAHVAAALLLLARALHDPHDQSPDCHAHQHFRQGTLPRYPIPEPPNHGFTPSSPARLTRCARSPPPPPPLSSCLSADRYARRRRCSHASPSRPT
jgi:hypothetical protein